jgi:hypothetical protein
MKHLSNQLHQHSLDQDKLSFPLWVRCNSSSLTNKVLQVHIWDDQIEMKPNLKSRFLIYKILIIILNIISQISLIFFMYKRVKFM